MDLINLPDEIIIIIIKKLDLRSVHSLYNTCSYIRNIVCMYGVIKECRMSLNTMATAQSLKLQFFKDISEHLQDLNLCGVYDLYKTSLLPAMKKLKSLRSLNVAYTNITILDFLEMHLVCPTIKNITINFKFYKPGVVKLPPHEVLIQCQKLFKQFENVHFVGSALNLLHSGLAAYILKEAKLCNLTYTLAERQITTFHKYDGKQSLHFNKFSVYFLNWKVEEIFCGNLISMLDLKKFEFLVIRVINCYTYTVYVSLLFKEFFKTNFGIDPECHTDFMEPYQGNVVMFAWNKDSTHFDDYFFSSLLKQLKQFFPCNYPSYSNIKSSMTYNNWFYIVPELEDIKERHPEKYEPENKKRRIVPQNSVLNYDDLLNEKQTVQLSLHFNGNIRNPVSLSSNSNYLKKLTFLSLVGPVRYSGEFFNILFRCCENLLTLNVEAPSVSQCTSPISRSIPLSQSLKHLRLIDKRIDFKTLFSSLSLCKTLENIHIQDLSNGFNDLADPSLIFEKCDNLYYFFIYASMTNSAKTKKSQMFNKAKSKCGRHHLYIELIASSNDNSYNYDPYISMFRLNPIKQ